MKLPPSLTLRQRRHGTTLGEVWCRRVGMRIGMKCTHGRRTVRTKRKKHGSSIVPLQREKNLRLAPTMVRASLR